MPVEPKPLFRPDALRPNLKSFQVPDSVAAQRGVVKKWADLLASAQSDAFSEQELLSDFVTDIFCNLLGYERPADNPARYTRAREKYIDIDGKYADAVLGEFKQGHPDKPIVALEGKGPKDPLERPFAGRKKSAVEQGYSYAINLPCDWIIVTSMRQTRLYHKGADQQTYERFDIGDLASNDASFRKFVFLFAAERVVPIKGECHFRTLKEASEKVGQTLTKKFYLEYADIRQDVFESLCSENPNESRHAILSATQKLLDRVLFTAFCEDRGLLPDDTLKGAFEHTDPYNPRPIWTNFRGLFRSIDAGNPDLNIPPYNGGLFADDPFLEQLTVPDSVCAYFRDLGGYEYRSPSEVAADVKTDGQADLIDVEILGHIFEQSITDLEQIRNELDGLVEPVGKEKHKTRRKKEGAFYTPSFITRYIVEQSLGGVLHDRFEQLRIEQQAVAKGAAKASLADPRVYQLDKLNKPAKAGLVKFWESWQDELTTIRLLDPACGSGAFLIEAFDQLHATYQHSNDRLAELRGHRTLFDLDKRILENNLYGVDLNEEAIEICRLSLWIKTAERGKSLTSLDHSIRVGNSVVADSSVHPKALDWQSAFPEVFQQGGFDVVVANPPYVRQEWLSEYKPYLQSAYKAYHGMADLYVYFYELGLRVLKPGGLLSFIVTNKWMKSGYGEPLRRLFSEAAWVESVVDFGHAKQIFSDADVFPSIIVARKPTQAAKPNTARLCSIPREQLRIDDLSRQIETEGFELPLEQLGADTWQLEPGGVNGLLAKIRATGVNMREFGNIKPMYGVKTGCNAAFLIDTATRNALVASDPNCAELVKPYLRGQDIDRWHSDWASLWMIFARRGIEIDNYPSIKQHLSQFREQLEPKPKGWQGDKWPGRKGGAYQWFEIQDSVDYWREFATPKIFYQVIQFHPSYAIDRDGMFGNDKTFFLPTDSLYLLAVLNSPLMWWYNWRTLTHLKDEALSPMAYMMGSIPIAQPSDLLRANVEQAAGRLIEITEAYHVMRRTVLDWLRVEYSIDKASQKLQSLPKLDSDAFVAEVKRIRGKKNPLSVAALKSLRDEHSRTIEPARAQAAEALQLERQLSDLVNEAYGLTPDEVALMWKTAPPRMPIPKPN
ncbi:MAG: N-6 DNA methylase [Planctomycetota bacterium]|nr:N-6 DNA methylase [Planctomycetota bacterium]